MYQYVYCIMRGETENDRKVLCGDVQEITIDVLSWDVSIERGSIGESLFGRS